MGLEVPVVLHQVERVMHVACPQLLIKLGHLQVHPLAKGQVGVDALLHGTCQPVLHASVEAQLICQLEYGLINPLATVYWAVG